MTDTIPESDELRRARLLRIEATNLEEIHTVKLALRKVEEDRRAVEAGTANRPRVPA